MKMSLSILNSSNICGDVQNAYTLFIQVLKGQGCNNEGQCSGKQGVHDDKCDRCVMTLSNSLPVDVNLWGENSEPYISDWDSNPITSLDYLVQSLFFYAG